MNGYAMVEGVELAAFKFYLATAERNDHGVIRMLSGIEPHFAAKVASDVDDAWIAALDRRDER